MDFSAVPSAVKKRVLTARKAGNDSGNSDKNTAAKLPGFRVSKGRLFSLTPRAAAPPPFGLLQEWSSLWPPLERLNLALQRGGEYPLALRPAPRTDLRKVSSSICPWHGP